MYDRHGNPIITEFWQDLPDEMFSAKEKVMEAISKIKINNTKMRLVSDDDGHYYLIPIEKEKEFYEWVEKWDEYTYGLSDCLIYLAEEFENFENYRIDGPHKLIIKEYELE